jgi:hypothetical protein
MEDGWFAVAQLAEHLAACRRTSLAVLLCCDSARAPIHPTSQPSAARCVALGIQEVLAIQGKISHDAAQQFLEQFLTALFVYRSVPLAAAAARRGSGNLHGAFLPTVFRNESFRAPNELHARLDSYRSGILKLAAQCRSPIDRVPRNTLITEVFKLFETAGVKAIGGPRFSGKSHLIQQAVRQRLMETSIPLSRPIFYIDWLAPGADNSSPIVTMRAIATTFNKHRDVLPDGTLATFQSVEALSVACKQIDDLKCIVILDNLVVKDDPKARQLWTDFFDLAGGMTNSLIVTVGSPVARDGEFDLSVSFFTPSETRAYVDAYLPGYIDKADAIHAYTGGTPFLLDALRSQYRRFGKVDMTGQGLLSPEGAAQVYTQTVLSFLSDQERIALGCFLRVSSATSARLAVDYLIPNGNLDALYGLEEIGVLQKLGEANADLRFVPAAKAACLREALREEMEQLAPEIVDRFVGAIGTNATDVVPEVYATPGGPQIILAVQRALQECGKHSLVFHLATLCDNERFVGVGLFELFRNAALSCDVPFRDRASIRAAQIAQALGRPDESSALLAHVDKNALSDFWRAQYLFALAARRKDCEQWAALDEIHADLDEALSLCERAYRDGGTEDALQSSWLTLWVQLLDRKIATGLFLERKPANDADKDVVQVRELMPDSSTYANVLCTLVERRLKSDVISDSEWQIIAQEISRAYNILRDTTDYRNLGYCCYQYGKYLERKPAAESRQAADMFAQAEECARLIGEPRRQALAGVRRIGLQWRNLQSPQSNQAVLPGARACAELDRLLEILPAKSTDSLTLRVLLKLCLLRAEIAEKEKLGSSGQFLLAACRAGARLPPGSVSDDRRLSTACQRYYEKALEIGDTVQARQFLTEFQQILIDRLGLESIDMNDLSKTHELLLQRMSNVGHSGDSHG